MLPLLACLSLAINCYVRSGDLTNSACKDLKDEGVCLKAHATFDTLASCEWNGNTCKSVCAELYKKSQELRMIRSHVFRKPTATNQRLKPLSVRAFHLIPYGEAVEENAELLKIDGVWDMWMQSTKCQKNLPRLTDATRRR